MGDRWLRATRPRVAHHAMKGARATMSARSATRGAATADRAPAIRPRGTPTGAIPRIATSATAAAAARVHLPIRTISKVTCGMWTRARVVASTVVRADTLGGATTPRAILAA